MFFFLSFCGVVLFVADGPLYDYTAYTEVILCSVLSVSNFFALFLKWEAEKELSFSNGVL